MIQLFYNLFLLDSIYRPKLYYVSGTLIIKKQPGPGYENIEIKNKSGGNNRWIAFTKNADFQRESIDCGSLSRFNGFAIQMLGSTAGYYMHEKSNGRKEDIIEYLENEIKILKQRLKNA